MFEKKIYTEKEFFTVFEKYCDENNFSLFKRETSNGTLRLVEINKRRVFDSFHGSLVLIDKSQLISNNGEICFDQYKLISIYPNNDNHYHMLDEHSHENYILLDNNVNIAKRLFMKNFKYLTNKVFKRHDNNILTVHLKVKTSNYLIEEL